MKLLADIFLSQDLDELSGDESYELVINFHLWCKEESRIKNGFRVQYGGVFFVFFFCLFVFWGTALRSFANHPQPYEHVNKCMDIKYWVRISIQIFRNIWGDSTLKALTMINIPYSESRSHFMS